MFESLCCAREWTLRPGSLLRRSLVCLIGVILTAIGITVALKGHAGVDPFTALLQGVSHITGLSFSWVVPVVNIALIALIFPFDHKVLGLGTVLNFTLVGVLVTSFTSTLDSIYVFTYSIPGMLAHLAIGLVIFALGLSLYITPDIGQGAAPCIPLPRLMRSRFLLRILRRRANRALRSLRPPGWRRLLPPHPETRFRPVPQLRYR